MGWSHKCHSSQGSSRKGIKGESVSSLNSNSLFLFIWLFDRVPGRAPESWPSKYRWMETEKPQKAKDSHPCASFPSVALNLADMHFDN